MRLAMLPLFVLAAPAIPQGADTPPAGGGGFTVAESGRRFAKLDDAVASLDGGNGTIRIAPGTYRDCTVVEHGRVAFVAEQPGTAIFERVPCEDKAALVLRGEGARVDGIVFRYLRVPDGNGAGIRLEKGSLDVTRSMFVDSQSGILTADDPQAHVGIDQSTFSGLGKDPTGNGAHSVYVGHYAAAKVTRCRFERGQGGHYLKSRAARIEVADSSFDDSAGSHTNYLIDLSEGAQGRISGNEFVQGPNKDNHGTAITVSPEGARNVAAGLTITGNRLRLAPGFTGKTAFVGDWSGEKIVVTGNQVPAGVKTVESHWM